MSEETESERNSRLQNKKNKRVRSEPNTRKQYLNEFHTSGNSELHQQTGLKPIFLNFTILFFMLFANVLFAMKYMAFEI